MPVFGLQTSLQNNANAILAAAFNTRYKKNIWSRIAASAPPSHRFVEPFALMGAAPLLAKFTGSVTRSIFNSWKLQMPMSLFKSFVNVARPDIEFDQTAKSVYGAMARVGARGAQTNDFALASKILRGHSDSSEVSFMDGATYNNTFEAGVPTFSANHTFGGKATAQSNIIVGNLPTSITAQTPAAIAEALQEDVQQIINTVAGWLDDKGAQLYPDFDPAQQMVIIHPPALLQGMQLVYKTGNALVAAATSGQSGSTTNVANTFVKDVINFNLLKGCADVYDKDLPFILPTDPMAYYICILDDFVRPAYWIPFVPPTGSDIIPRGYDAGIEAEQVKKLAADAGMTITAEAAEAYASMMVDHNLGAIGANAQAEVVTTEQFFMSPRMYGNFVMGPWFTWLKVIPSGTTS